MKKVLAFFTSKNFYSSITTIIILMTMYLVLKNIINKYVLKNKQTLNKRKVTYFKLLKNILKYVMLIILIMILLEINGVRITSLVAGLGLVSVIAGLALQDALKDIIMGFNLIIDDYYSVGDVVKINEFEGKVLYLGLKTTKLQDVVTGQSIVIANRNITNAAIISNILGITIPLPYELQLKDAEKVIGKINEEIAKIKDVSKVEYVGIDDFADSAINYKILIYTKSDIKLSVKRKANNIIKTILDNNNIAIPYTQIDIHNK